MRKREAEGDDYGQRVEFRWLVQISSQDFTGSKNEFHHGVYLMFKRNKRHCDASTKDLSSRRITESLAVLLSLRIKQSPSHYPTTTEVETAVGF